MRNSSVVLGVMLAVMAAGSAAAEPPQRDTTAACGWWAKTKVLALQTAVGETVTQAEVSYRVIEYRQGPFTTEAVGMTVVESNAKNGLRSGSGNPYYPPHVLQSSTVDWGCETNYEPAKEPR